jgi:hypothetical protein
MGHYLPLNRPGEAFGPPRLQLSSTLTRLVVHQDIIGKSNHWLALAFCLPSLQHFEWLPDDSGHIDEDKVIGSGW